MTEDEARKKWCPFARSFQTEQDEDGVNVAMASVNRARDGEPDPWCLCIASNCMAWRWRGDQTLPITPAHEGYCGLASKP